MAAGGAPRALTLRALRGMPLPEPDGGKEQRGRVLVIGGSRRVPGAAMLAGVGALRAGAGKLQIATVEDAAMPLAIAVPEALVLGLPMTAHGEIARATAALDHALAGADAVLVGTGMVRSAATRTLVRHVLQRTPGAVVLDAGALEPDLVAPPGRPFVLTPHAGEMAGLAALDKGQVKRRPEQLAQAFARRTRGVMVLKGATTHVALPDGALWVHRGGCRGLGTSGSGDALAGIIAGLAARCGDPVQAALWGVWAHAQAGRRLSRAQGTLGFLAREIAGQVPGVLDAAT